MKIARRKRAQAGNWVFQPRRCKICVSNRIEQFSASYFQTGSVPPVPPPSKGPAESGPEGGGEGIALLLRFDTLAGGVSKHLLGGLVDVVGLGGDGGDGRHDRLPLSAQSKGDFRPRKL